jgi:gentisate 1,2-dioxygenase
MPGRFSESLGSPLQKDHEVSVHDQPFDAALIYVMSRDGYSLVHDQKVGWHEGCVLRVPTFCWHTHYNTGSKPAIFLKNITSGLNNHLKWILLDNLPGREIGETPLRELART